MDRYSADSDGDGVDDSVEWPGDTDGDRVFDSVDLDDDGDGIPTEVELNAFPDPNGDGIPNYLDADSDGDGIPDADETVYDSDANGIPDYLDPIPAWVPPPAGDLDGDGLTNGDEVILGTNPRAADTDGDGLDDFAETRTNADTDRDGIRDVFDPIDDRVTTSCVSEESAQLLSAQLGLAEAWQWDDLLPNLSRQDLEGSASESWRNGTDCEAQGFDCRTKFFIRNARRATGGLG